MSIARGPRHWLLAVCAVFAAGCSDSVTAPITQSAGNSGTLSFADSVYTRGAVVRATVQAPAGFTIVPGSVQWTGTQGSATVTPVAGSTAADVLFTNAGPVELRATFSMQRGNLASSLGNAGPTTRSSGTVQATAVRTITVGAPTLAYAVRPTASATAGAALGGVRVELRDARGRVLTGASDSVVITLDPASGTTGAALIGAVRARAVAGVASFNDLSIRRVGTAYRLIASSPGAAKTDSALVNISAGAPNAAASTMTLSRTTTTAGDTLTVTVTVRDEWGNPVLDATPAALGAVASAGQLGAFTCTAGVCTARYTAPLLAGTPTIGVTIGGANVGGSPAPVTVLAGAPARFVIIGANTQTAGTAQTVTIRAIDAFGNIAVGYTGAKPLTFAGALVAPLGTVATAGGTAFGSTASITFVNGVATASMTLFGAGSNVVSATDGSVTTSGADRLTVNVVHNTPAPAQTIVSLSPATVRPGGTVTVTLTLRDAWGNPVLNATPDMIRSTPTDGSISAFTCSNGVCTATYTAPNAAGPYPLPFTVGGQTLPPGNVTVQAGAAARLSITGANVQVAGTTQNITVRALDQGGNLVPGYTGMKVLRFTGAGAAPDGTNPTVAGQQMAMNVEVTFVDGVATVPMRLFLVETAIISVTDGTLSSVGPDRLTVVVSAGAAARLRITGAATQAAGATQNITLTATDNWGNRATTYTGAKSLTFSGASVAGGTNAPRIGATAFGSATSVTFANGVATGVPMTLFAVETANIAATDGTISASGTSRLTVQVSGGVPSAATSTLALSASILVPGQQITVTVTLRDAFGNLVTGATASSFTPAVSGAAVLGSFSCTNGVCTATYTAPLLAGGYTISAAIGGTDIVNSPANVTVVPGVPSRFVIIGNATQNAGASQNITIRALDAYGNIATGYAGAKNLTFSGASVSPASNAPTVSGTAFGSTTSVTFTAGVATGVPLVLYTAETAVVATTDGTISAAGADRLSVTVAFGAADAARSTLAVSPTTVTIGGTATATVTVRDAYGNVVTNATSSSFSTATGPGPNGGTLGSFNCVSGVCTSTYTAPLVTGTKTISATIGGTDIGNSPANVTVTPGAASRFVILGNATQNAGASQTITIRALDASGNIVTGYTGAKTLTFSGATVSPAGNAPTIGATAFGSNTSVTFANGEATVSMTLYTAETAVIGTTDGTISASAPVDSRLSVTVAFGAADAGRSTLAVSPSSVAIGGTATATVTVRDAYGNVVTNATSSSFSTATGPGPNGGTLGSFNCVSGVCTSTYTAPLVTGTKTISATIGGTDIGNSPANVTVTPGAAARFVIFGNATQVAGASQNITIRALDASGNIATGYTGAKTLTFSGASVSPNGDAPKIGATAFGSNTSVTFSNGEATVSMTLYTAETAVVGTTDGTISASSPVDARLSVTVSADTASPVVTDVTASPTSIVADGSSTSTITVTLKDAWGNPTSNVTGAVALSLTSGTGTLLGSLVETSPGSGVYTQQLRSAASAGSGTVFATLNSVQTTKSATVTYAAAGGVLSRVVCTASQPAGQNAAANTTVNLCPGAQPGDLELVTLALDEPDNVIDPVVNPSNGTWVKVSSTTQSTGPGGNKSMLLVVYARRYETGNARSVTFTASTNHKWSVDMVTLQSSPTTAMPNGADVSVAQNATGASLTVPGSFTATDNNTVLLHIIANSATGATVSGSLTGLTTLGTNNTGGTSSLSFLEMLASGETGTARTFSTSVSANTVVLRLVVRP